MGLLWRQCNLLSCYYCPSNSLYAAALPRPIFKVLGLRERAIVCPQLSRCTIQYEVDQRQSHCLELTKYRTQEKRLEQ